MFVLGFFVDNMCCRCIWNAKKFIFTIISL